MTATRTRDPRPKFEKPKGLKSRSDVPDPERDYFVVTYTGPDTIVSLPPQSLTEWRRFDHGGDHFHVADVAGPDAVLIRLGAFTNPPIRVRRGMTFRRKFRSFWVATVGLTAADTTLGRYRTEATFYVSTGPFVVAENPYGVHGRFERGFLGQSGCFATTTSRLLMRDLWDRGYINPDVPIHMGRENETLILTNDSLASPLYWLYGLAGQPWAGAQPHAKGLAPGATLVLELGDAMAGYDPYHFGTPPVATFYEGLCVVVPAGTCEYSWVMSSNRTERLAGREFYAGVGY